MMVRPAIQPAGLRKQRELWKKNLSIFADDNLHWVSDFQTINVTPIFGWQTAVSQSTREDATQYFFGRNFYPTVQSHFLSVTSRSPKGPGCWDTSERETFQTRRHRHTFVGPYYHWVVPLFNEYLGRQTEVCFQPWCNPLLLTGLKAPTD